LSNPPANRRAAEKEGQAVLGAVIGDIVGSRFEWDNIRTKDFGGC
jgi:ADP-ribosylglycohydrolase